VILKPHFSEIAKVSFSVLRHRDFNLLLTTTKRTRNGGEIPPLFDLAPTLVDHLVQTD
jgi:hypothetical protein